MSVCYRNDCSGAGCQGGGKGCPITDGRLDEEVATERACGACSLCCKVMSMDTSGDRVEIVKEDGILCRFCRPDANEPCTIYAARPRVCKGFICGWLAGILGDHWNPKECGLVFSAAAGRDEPIAIWCDEDHRDWQVAPFWPDLLAIAEAYLIKLGKFTVVYPPRYRPDRDRYWVVDPIGGSVLPIEQGELVVLLMDLQYLRIDEANVEQWREDIPKITEAFGKAATPEAQLDGLTIAKSRGWKFDFAERKIMR